MHYHESGCPTLRGFEAWAFVQPTTDDFLRYACTAATFSTERNPLMFIRHRHRAPVHVMRRPCRTGSIDTTVRGTRTSSLRAATSGCRCWARRGTAICFCGCWSRCGDGIALWLWIRGDARACALADQRAAARRSVGSDESPEARLRPPSAFASAPSAGLETDAAVAGA